MVCGIMDSSQTNINPEHALIIGSFILANTAGIIASVKWLFNQALQFQLITITTKLNTEKISTLEKDIKAAHNKIRELSK